MTSTAPPTDRRAERPAAPADRDRVRRALAHLDRAERGGATVVRIEHLRVLLGGDR